MRCAEKLYARGKLVESYISVHRLSTDQFPSRYFRSGKPYAITIAGGTTVVIGDTTDLAAVWRNTTALSYDPFVSRMLTAFGISKKNVNRVFHDNPASLIPQDLQKTSLLCIENPQEKCYMHLQSEWFKKQLLPGDNLKQLVDDYNKRLCNIMTMENLTGDFITGSNGNDKSPSMTVSLGRLNRHVLSHCAFRAFFGESLFKIEPRFAQIYQAWEDDSWKVFYNYPYILAKDLHDARLRAIECLAQYFEQPRSDRQASWIFGIMDDELSALDLPRFDRAGMIMMICWA
jgi:hypothetical protein